jgi:hypothetical protein
VYIRPIYIVALVIALALPGGAWWWTHRSHASRIDVARLTTDVQTTLNKRLTDDRIVGVGCVRDGWKLTCLASRESGDTIGVDATCQSDGQCIWRTSDPVLDLRAASEESAAVKANVRSIIPTIEQYYADNSTYEGMTLEGLQANYDQALDVSKYELGALSSTDYCVQSTSALATWRYTATGGFVAGACPY